MAECQNAYFIDEFRAEIAAVNANVLMIGNKIDGFHDTIRSLLQTLLPATQSSRLQPTNAVNDNYGSNDCDSQLAICTYSEIKVEPTESINYEFGLSEFGPKDTEEKKDDVIQHFDTNIDSVISTPEESPSCSTSSIFGPKFTVYPKVYPMGFPPNKPASKNTKLEKTGNWKKDHPKEKKQYYCTKCRLRIQANHRQCHIANNHLDGDQSALLCQLCPYSIKWNVFQMKNHFKFCHPKEIVNFTDKREELKPMIEKISQQLLILT